MPSPKYPKLFHYNETRTRYVVYAIWRNHFPGSFDPIVEIFAKIKNSVTSLSNLPIGKEHHGNEFMTRYHIGVNYAETDESNFDAIEDRFVATAPKVIDRLFEEIDKWAKAENGQAAILECETAKAAREAMDAYLVSVDLRTKRLTKEERRQVFCKEHPEYAKTARPKKKTTAAIKTATELLRQM